jgi:ketosteroid isomerase-like protein
MSLSSDDMIHILQLYSRYSTAIDTGDGAGFGDCFVPDGVFDSGIGVSEGRKAIGEFAIQTHSAMPGMRHNATNIVLEGDGQTATGSAFLIGYLVDGGYKVITTGRYTDELTKTNEGWRFCKRVYIADG